MGEGGKACCKEKYRRALKSERGVVWEKGYEKLLLCIPGACLGPGRK